MQIQYFTDYTPFKVIIKYWLYFLCCAIYPCSLYILYIVVFTSEVPTTILPTFLLSPLVTPNFLSLSESASISLYSLVCFIF